MISDELLNKFASIEDLPVSEELLGAYLEGNRDDAECIIVNNAIDSFSDVSAIVIEIQSIENSNPLGIPDFSIITEVSSIVGDIELPDVSDNILSDSPVCLLGESSFIDFQIEDQNFDDIKHFHISNFDPIIGDSDINLSHDDSFYTSSDTLESNDSTDSLPDEDMFNPNLDF